MISHKRIDKNTTSGHVLFLYDSEEDRLSLLSKYFLQGLRKNELCIFVTSDPLEDAIRKFEAIGFPAGKYVQKHSLRIFDMIDTYVPNSQFIKDFMLKNVRSFMDDAKSQGYSGIRTAGEMGWLDSHQAAIDSASLYEQDVNKLATPDDNFVGLCLYPAHSISSRVLESAVHSHPTLIYEEKVQLNPYFALR